MPNTRRALLISNPGVTGEANYCKGVYVDVLNYTNFLKSPCGGDWKSTEIITLDRPSTGQVREQVMGLSGYDYSFVAFAGHGWFSKPDNATVLTLRKGEQISAIELLAKTTRRTVVLDCCREIRNESAMIQMSRKMAFSAAAFKRQPIAALCRAKFDTEVIATPQGFVTLHSCLPDQFSGDSEVSGGQYTSSLIGVANAWAEAISDHIEGSASAALSTVSAHDLAAERTETQTGGTQKPWVEKARGQTRYLPFAVFA